MTIWMKLSLCLPFPPVGMCYSSSPVEVILGLEPKLYPASCLRMLVSSHQEAPAI